VVINFRKYVTKQENKVYSVCKLYGGQVLPVQPYDYEGTD